jgi:GH15 family glucan-1,4-alpha-glucosidase
MIQRLRHDDLTSERSAFMSDMDLAVIGNSVIAALVDRRARIVWCCFPRFDGDPIFCSLLEVADDPTGAGLFDIELTSLRSANQEYVRNTAMLVTTLTDDAGAIVQITDFAPRFRHYGRLFRPTVLVRRIAPLAGSPRLRIRVRPRSDHGATPMRQILGSNHVRYTSPNLALRLTTDAPISYIAEEVPFVLEGPVNLILGPDEGFAAPIAATTREYFELTQDYWFEWTRYLSVPFEWQEAVIRAAITLKLCSFEETGAIVAALTTSIPESPDSGRTWDYRYCWLRDAYFVVQALNQLGATLTMEEFLHYIINIAALGKDRRLRPVYAIVPGVPLPEREIDGLRGYRGMGPVRIGNLAERQVQNDVYGNVVLAAAQMFFDRRLPRTGDTAMFTRLEELGQWAAVSAFEPDASLWEFRGRERVHTFSSAMCWAACDRLAKIAGVLGLSDRVSHWRKEADRIRITILEQAWDAKQNTFVESLGGNEVDASLLLLQEIGFIAASDPRFLGTIAAVEKRLRHGYHVFRYATPDDFGAPTVAFTVCTLWYVNALAAVGRREEAREIFEHVLSCRNHVGLLSEDVDPHSGELWGNFPQSYSMVGLIISATRLSRTWEEAFWRG